MAWNGLGFEGSLALEEVFKANTSLKFVDVSNNRINWEGVTYVAKGLKRNGTLQMLKVFSIFLALLKTGYTVNYLPFCIRKTTFMTSCLLSCTPSPFCKMIYSKGKRICSIGIKFFPFGVDTLSKGRGGQSNFDRVVVPVSVSIFLRLHKS